MKRCVKYLLILPPLLLCGLALCLSHGSPVGTATEIPAATEDERIRWLASQGLRAELLGSQTVTVPLDFSGSYAGYAALQEHLQLPLAAYAGEAAACITYKITDSEPQMYAELLTANGLLIGAQCYLPEEGVTLDMQGHVFTALTPEP